MTSVPPQLTKYQTELQQINPLDATAQAVEYQAQRWVTYIGADDADLECLTRRYLGAITRGHLASLARSAHAQRDSSSARRLFLGAMLWGYGNVGYGPYRVAKMLEATHVPEVLLSTLDLIRNGAIRRAYERFDLPMCGSAFFTKYLYFAGLGWDVSVWPLILDSMVLNELEQWLRLDVRRFARFSRNKKGQVSVVGRDAARYEHYVQVMNGWARCLRCRPDSIELFLFQRRRSRVSAPIAGATAGSLR